MSIDPNSFKIVPATPEEVALYPEFTALKNNKPSLEAGSQLGGGPLPIPGQLHSHSPNWLPRALPRPPFSHPCYPLCPSMDSTVLILTGMI